MPLFVMTRVMLEDSCNEDRGVSLTSPIHWKVDGLNVSKTPKDFSNVSTSDILG